MLQVFREDHLQRDVRGAGALLFRGHRRLAGPELADRPGHGRAAGGQEDPAEDAPEAHAATAPVREDRHAAVRGERVRVRGQERVADVRPGGVDRVQRGPLAAGHTGRAGRHVQLSGAQDLHAVVRPAASAAAQRQRGRAVRQARQRHQRHDVLTEPHVGPRPVARLKLQHADRRDTGTATRRLRHDRVTRRATIRWVELVGRRRGGRREDDSAYTPTICIIMYIRHPHPPHPYPPIHHRHLIKLNNTSLHIRF